MESFGRLEEEGYEFISELATHAAEERNGGSMPLKGAYKERLSSGRISGNPISDIDTNTPPVQALTKGAPRSYKTENDMGIE